MKVLTFLDSIAGYVRNSPSNGSSSADRPIRLAKIDSTYAPFSTGYPADGAPAARVIFEGEDQLSGKYYPVANGFVPARNQRVWMVPIGTTYLIAGGANQETTQGWYSNADTNTIGVEFGDGNYFDTLEGLQLKTDASFDGSVYVDDALDVGASRMVSNEKITSGLLGNGTNATTAFANVPAPSSMSFTKKYAGDKTKLIIYLKMSLRVTAGTVPTVAKIGVNISGGSGDHEVDHAVLHVSATHYTMVGLRELTGFAAGTYTIQARYRPVSAGVTIGTDGNDYITLHVREVSV